MRTVFFRRIFQDTEGFLCISVKRNNGRFDERFFKYPDSIAGALEYIAESESYADVYYCTQLLVKPRRSKENIEFATIAWADLDYCKPERLLVEPSITIESSPGRYQALWCFEHPETGFDAEQVSKRIAYFHRNDGADISGWDLTQLLRVPGSTNHKPEYRIETARPTVKVVKRSKALYRLGDFAQYPHIQGETFEPRDLDGVKLPNKTPLEILDAYRAKLPDIVWEWFSIVPQQDWSKALWHLEKTLLEVGLSPEEAFIVCAQAKCNKYARDGRPSRMLWAEICKADEEVKQKKDTYNLRFTRLGEMLYPEEVEQVEADRTIVEDYVEWANLQTDAAPQYHQAGIFTILSALGASNIRLASSFGNIIPNLWFMILGDTTLTRKTTAMRMATEMLMEINPGILLATDTSAEGMISALALRDGQASLFYRDEIAGLFKMVNKRDHLAGMMEMFTGLYDGSPTKRTLRSQTITVQNPVLIFFGGGIRNKVYAELTEEHIESGFLPRFVFIQADTDPEALRPLGRRTMEATDTRDVLVERLTKFYYKYSQLAITNIASATITSQMICEADLTDETWARYQQLEQQMTKDGLSSDVSDLTTPMYTRLAMSILKAAVLIAASRMPEGNAITVELRDLLKAIYYGREWRTWANEVLTSTGRTLHENKLISILKTVMQEPGITKGLIMRRHKLMSREAEQYLQTLIDRELVRSVLKNKAHQYWPKDVTD